MKKGFTLIELLAVIVILAIIALIATPIVLDIIEDSKNSSIRESVNMYKSAAENAIATSAMNDGLEDGTYIIDSKGNLKYKDKEIKVDIKNYNFESGILVIEQGQIKDIKLIQNDKVTTGKELNKIDKWDGKTVKEVTPDSNGIYHITKASELSWVAQQVNNGEIFEGKTISLDASLDLGGRYDKDGNKLGTEWTPIGVAKSSSQINYFKGTFEGNNNIISGIYISKPLEDSNENKNLGLFGHINSATIRNLIIKDSYVKGYGYLGILSGNIVNSTIKNIIANNSKINVSTAAGIVLGYTENSTLENLYTYDGVVNSMGRFTGGVVGDMGINSSLNFAYSNATIENLCDEILTGTGGIIGRMSNSISSDLTSEATVYGYSDTGGIVGQFRRNSILKKSISYADVSGSNYLGGVIGVDSGYPDGSTLEDIKSYARVNGDGEYVGGVIGELTQGNNYFTNIYSKSEINGKNKVGGIIGGFIENYETTLNYKNIITESSIVGETNTGELFGYINSKTTLNKLD